MIFKRLLYQAVVGRGLYFLSVFLLNILFTRYYKAADSSSIYYLVNLYSFVLLIASFSLESGMGYFVANKEADVRSLSVFAFFWTILLSVISLGLLKIYFLFFDSSLSRDGLFWMTALTYIPGQLLITFFLALFYARQSVLLPNSILLAVNFLLILLVPANPWIPSGFGAEDYLRIYFTGVLIQGVGLTAAFVLKYGVRPLGWLSDRRLLKKIFHYSSIAFAANIVFFLVYRIDYWFVKYYCSPDELGNYIQVSKFGQLLLVLPGIIAGVVFPGTTLDKEGKMPVHLFRMIRIAILLFCLLSAGLLFIGKGLFPLVFGNSFDKMYIPALILLPGIGCLSIVALLSAYFGGLRRPDVNMKAALAGLLVIITGDLWLVPRYKIAGAAAVSSAGYFVCMLYSLMAFRKSHNIRT